MHADYAALLGDDEIDAVYNPLPNGLHGEWTIAALEAGKHVLCEKPFTANAVEAQAVADVAARTGKVVMEAFHYRYHPLFARVLRARRHARHHRRHLGPDDRGAAEPQRRPLPARSRGRCDDGRRLLRDPPDPVDCRLRARTGSRPARTEAPVTLSAHAKVMSPGIDRAMRATFAFADGPSASMECAMLEARAPIADLRITGEQGRVHVHFPTRPELAWITTKAGSAGGSDTRRERVKGLPTFWYQLQAFCGAALRDEPTLTGPADAVATMRVIDAVYEASGLGPRQPSH